MQSSQQQLQLEQELLKNLRYTYLAPDNNVLQQANSWLREHHNQLLEPFVMVLTTPQECTVHRNVVAVQQAVCVYLRKSWQLSCDGETLKYGLRILCQEQLQLKVAREFSRAFMRVLQQLALDQKRGLLGEVLGILKRSDNLVVASNLLALLSVLISCIDSFNLLELFAEFYGRILELTTGLFTKAAEQMRVVLESIASDDFDQRQMTVFELVLQASNECILITIGFLEKANEEQEMYMEILNQLYTNAQFKQVILQATCMNVPGVVGIIWRTPLKQAEAFNSLKSHLMRVINQVYPEPLEGLLHPALATIMEHNNRQECQYTRSVLFDCLAIIQKFIGKAEKYGFFSSIRHGLMYCLLKYCISNRQEYSEMEDSPEIFVEISKRCCQREIKFDLEEEQELKEKALAVLLYLAYVLDGLLARLLQTLIIIIDSALMKEDEQHDRYESFLEQFERNGYKKSSISIVERVESSLLVLAALSYHLVSRPDLKLSVQRIVEHRFKQIWELAPICLNRLIMLAAQYPLLSYVRCFPNIIGNCGQSTKLQIAQALTTILGRQIRPEMKFEFQKVSLEIIKRISCLDKAFEVIVEKHPDLVDSLEGRKLILGRLVKELEVNYQHRPQSILSNVNRLSLMICHFFERIPEPSTYQQELSPALQLVLLHPDCEQSIIEIAVTYLDRCQHVTELQRSFLKLAVQTIQRNGFVLNSCFELMYRHLLYSNYPEDRQLIILVIMRCLELSTVEVDMWELGQLCELVILTSKEIDESIRTLLVTVHNIMQNDNPKNAGHVLSEVYLCLIYKYKDLAVGLLGDHLEPMLIRFTSSHCIIQAPLLKKVHCMYLLELLELEVRITHSHVIPLFNLIINLMGSFLPKSQMQVEEANTADVYQICLNQKLKELDGKHPLYRTDMFELLTQKWENLIRLNPTLPQHPDLNRQMLGQLLSSRTIDNTAVRRVHRIKR